MEGPKEIIIPEQKFYSCRGCEWYSHHMIKSGFNSTYRDVCTFKKEEDSFDFLGLSGPQISMWYGIPITPEDCPLYYKIREDKINKINDVENPSK